MGLKNNILSWFIKNFIISNYKNYKSPGFIIVSFKTPDKKDVYFREVLFPEDLLVEIEKKVLNFYKKDGKQVLYDIGVTLGYNFANIFGVPVVGKQKDDEIEKYITFTMKFNFSTWCKNAEIKFLDLKNHKIDLEIEDHVICRKNGEGIILTSGAESGFGKYLFNDKNYEVVQTKCVGRKDKFCETIWRSEQDLKKDKIDYIKGKVLVEIKDFQAEKNYNLIKPATFCKKSTFDFINSKIFLLDDGKIVYKNYVLFDCSSLLYYLIEEKIGLLKGGSKILYDTGFDYGRKIGVNNSAQLIPDLLSCFGFGDSVITQNNKQIQVTINHFPWSILEKNVKDFSLIRGFISGILTEVLKRPVNLIHVEKLMQNDVFVLIFKE